MNYRVSRIVDDSPEEKFILGIPLEYPSEKYNNAIVTIGNCRIREKIANTIKVEQFINAIHPSAIIAESVIIGEGMVIVHGAIVQACTSIGNHCIINTKASVGHDVTLDDFVHVAFGATICGGLRV